MKQKEVESMLDEMGIEYRYHHFEEDEAIAPPFLVYLIPESNNFAADGITYFETDVLNLELYTDYRDFNLEKQIEEVLEKYEIFWEKENIYIESEKMYETIYTMEV